MGLRSAKPLPANSASNTGIVTTCWATRAARSPAATVPPTVACICSANRSKVAARSASAPTAVWTWLVMVPVMRATSRPQRSQYCRSPQAFTSCEAMACSNGSRCWPARTLAASLSRAWSHSQSLSALPQVPQSPLGSTVMGGFPVRSAVLMSTSSRSSCERSALSTFHTALKSEPFSTASSSRLVPDGTTTGRIT